MSNHDFESSRFSGPPKSVADIKSRRRSGPDFRQLPTPTGQAPYHLDLATVLPLRTAEIEAAQRLVLHVVGDTGDVGDTGAQRSVADHMTEQIFATKRAKQPSFCYILGDIVYKNGEEEGYYDQFYYPYEDYPAPLFAIPGNHDGKTLSPTPSLGPFMKHFCSPSPVQTPEAYESNRTTMIQPNCYWRLAAPFLTVVGLYSNVSGDLDEPGAGATPQRDWLVNELRTAPRDKCLAVAVHHSIYTLTKRGGFEHVESALESAIVESGRMPDVVLSAHDHNYQRFTRRREGWRIPYLVVGASGKAGYDSLDEVKDELEPPDGVKLKAFNDSRPGFGRLTVTAATVTWEYFTVPRAGKEHKREKLRDRFVLNYRTHRFVD